MEHSQMGNRLSEVLALQPTGWVTLGKSLNFPEFQIPRSWSGNNLSHKVIIKKSKWNNEHGSTLLKYNLDTCIYMNVYFLNYKTEYTAASGYLSHAYYSLSWTGPETNVAQGKN